MTFFPPCFKSCDYVEINKFVELADLKKEIPTKSKSIVKSDLVFSPAQVTEHRCVELKDQEITQETRESFENSRVSTQGFFDKQSGYWANKLGHNACGHR